MDRYTSVSLLVRSAVLLSVFVASTASAQTGRLVFNTSPQTLPHGAVTTTPLTVQRQTLAGVPLAAGQPALTVTVTTDSSQAYFWYVCEGPSSATLTLTIPAGASVSQSFLYADARVGTSTLTATAPSFNAGTQQQTITAAGRVEDAESTPLLCSSTPPGYWTSNTSFDAANSASLSTSAAHRGTKGIRAIDGRSSAGGGSELRLASSLGRVSPALYQRFWFRLAAHNNVGEADISLNWSGGVFATMSELMIVNPGASLRLAGHNGAGDYFFSDVPGFNLATGSWYLVEQSLTGLGSTSGALRLWVNGQLRHSVSNINWTGAYVDDQEIGFPWANAYAFTATADFDDLATSSAPMPSHFGVSAAASAATGACIPVTVSLLDSVSNAPAAAPYAFAAGLTIGGGVTGSFFTAAGCGTATSTATFAAGVTSQTVYFQATSSGAASLGANFVDYFPASANVTVTLAPAARLAFTTPARTLTAGACSGPGNVITVQLQDGAGAPVSAGAGGRSFTASSSSTGSVSWFTDASCALPAAGGAFTIPSGANSVALYYRDTRAGTPSVALANGAGLINPTPQAYTVNPAAASVLAFTSAPQSLPAGGCSGGVVVQSRDAFGNVSAVSASTALTLSSSSLGATLYSDACVTALSSPALPSGASSFTFRFRDTRAGTPMLSASGAGFAVVTQQQAVTGGPATSLVITGHPTTIGAGVSYTFTVSALDSGGNPASGYTRTVGFSSSDAAATLPSARTYDGVQPGNLFVAALRTVGTASMTATDDSVPPLTVTASGITVTPGAPTSPQILSLPNLLARCGEPAQYAGQAMPAVTSALPVTWSLEPAPGAALPSGMAVDASTGVLEWTPDRGAVEYRFVLRASNAQGSDAQTVEGLIDCGPPVPLGVGCGCGSGGAGTALAGVLVALLWAGRGRAKRSARPHATVRGTTSGA